MYLYIKELHKYFYSRCIHLHELLILPTYYTCILYAYQEIIEIT